jgi:hypothetical protein
MIEGGITPLHSYEELKAMGFQVRGGTDRWRTAQLLFGVVSRALGRQSLMMISPPSLINHQIIIHPMSSIFAATKALVSVYDTLAKKGTTREDMGAIMDMT